MADVDALLADYSRLLGEIACHEHSLRDLGGRLTKLGEGLTGSPITIAASRGGRFEVNSTEYVAFAEVQLAWQNVVDLADARKKVQDLARTLAQTEHAHMVRSDR